MAHLYFKSGSSWVDLVDTYWPIGSVYLAVNTTSPAVKFGGTWTRLTGAVLAASGGNGFATEGAKGGSLKIDTSQMPSHKHQQGGGTWIAHVSKANGAETGVYQSTVAGGDYGILVKNSFTATTLTATETGGAELPPLPHLHVCLEASLLAQKAVRADGADIL